VSAPKGDLERAFTDPPVSWEQVLHPEKYWTAGARDLPRPVAVPDLASTLGDGWALSDEGGVGEMLLAILTDPKADQFDPATFPQPRTWTNEAASGWGGDRWQLYRRGDDTVTVLATVWDTEKDAREFRKALPRPLRRTSLMERDAVVLVAGEPGKRAGALAREALRVLTRAGRSLEADGSHRLFFGSPPAAVACVSVPGQPPSHDTGSRGSGTETVPKPLPPRSSRYCTR